MGRKKGRRKYENEKHTTTEKETYNKKKNLKRTRKTKKKLKEGRGKNDKNTN